MITPTPSPAEIDSRCRSLIELAHTKLEILVEYRDVLTTACSS